MGRSINEVKDTFTAAMLDLVETAAEAGYEPWGLVRSSEGIVWQHWLAKLNAERAAPEEAQKAS